MRESQIVQKLNESSLSYRWTWVEKMFNKKYFFRSGFAESLPIIKKIIELLDSVFEDKWCFHFNSTTSFPSIWIHFPEFTITNSKGDSHNIRDLFVILDITVYSENIKILGDRLRGFRTTLTYKELVSGYQHSHLYPRNDYFSDFDDNMYLGNFCLGTSEIGDLIQIINNEPFDEGVFELFLVLLKDVFKWESLEGTPYIGMRNISSYRNSKKEFRIESSMLEEAVNCILSYPSILRKCNYSVVENSLKIVDDTFFINSLKTLFLKEGKANLLCTVNEDKYMEVKDEIVTFLENPNKHILFRGYKKPLKIINTNVFCSSQDNNINKYTIYPFLLDRIMDKINSEINKKLTKYYVKRRRTENFRKFLDTNKSNSEGISDKTDTASMQYYQLC